MTLFIFYWPDRYGQNTLKLLEQTNFIYKSLNKNQVKCMFLNTVYMYARNSIKLDV